MSGVRITQHGLNALTSRRYGSFAGKTVLVGSDVEIWTPISEVGNVWSAIDAAANVWTPMDDVTGAWRIVDR
jgi:hypothetical protein